LGTYVPSKNITLCDGPTPVRVAAFVATNLILTMAKPRRSISPTKAKARVVQRVQTGVKLEKRLLLVCKALAGTLDLSLGDLLEGIVLHAFEGKPPFSATTLGKVRALRAVYGLDLTAADSHRLVEADDAG
jgi:hypothetical protein